MDLGRGCARYRPILVDFVDRGDVREDTAAGLAHLDRCSGCTEAIESTLLTITALRRIGDEAAAVEPGADAWPRLLVRIQGWRRRPATMSPLAGLAMSFAIVAVLVLPVQMGGSRSFGPQSPSPTPAVTPSHADLVLENEFLARQRVTGVSTTSVVVPNPRLIYPDNYQPNRKEVDSTKPMLPAAQSI